MNGKEAIATALHSTQHIMKTYLSDLSDADILLRPVPEANSTAWQIGHLIAAEQNLVRRVIPTAAFPELPADFAKKHSPEASHSDSAEGFLKKDQYVSLFEQTRAATLAALSKLNDADLDKPNSGPLATIAPTIGALLILVSNHTLMHAGQFVVVRRKLKKPVLI